MTKFNPENKEVLTYGDCLSPAMNITDPEDAQQYLAEYVKHIQHFMDKEPRTDNMTAEDVAKSNFGYFAGYYDNDTRTRVEKLFMCAHPIFGNIETPTPDQAFDMGLKSGKNR